MNKGLLVLLACVFSVMIGLGITLPVLPFYVERLALAAGTSRQGLAVQVGLLTGVYALGQFFFAPVWGRLSDRVGRRPLVVIGIGGYVVSQVLFGLANSIELLYVARVLGGILSSAVLPVAAAYVSDVTTERARARGMAWLGAAVSLGFVVGPALGGLLARRDLHFAGQLGHLRLDGFSVPFFTAALIALVSLLAALRWLPESLPKQTTTDPSEVENGENSWLVIQRLGALLGLTFAGQFALALYEGIFALHAQSVLKFGLTEIGAVFVVCGLVMSVFQVGAVGWLDGRISELQRVGTGFAVVAVSLGLMALARTPALVFGLAALIALGIALISPNVSSLISRRAGGRVGTALGIQNAANSLGQASGPLVGGLLFAWRIDAPYLLTAALLLVIATVIGWRVRTSHIALVTS